MKLVKTNFQITVECNDKICVTSKLETYVMLTPIGYLTLN